MRLTRAIKRGAIAASWAAVLLMAPPARAQAPAQGTNKVAAEALFEDGRRLVAAGSFTEACPKFADSERLDPSPGTLLNLASCYEKLVRTKRVHQRAKRRERGQRGRARRVRGHGAAPRRGARSDAGAPHGDRRPARRGPADHP